jgi:Ca2+-binding RTX toxin-like protein
LQRSAGTKIRQLEEHAMASIIGTTGNDTLIDLSGVNDTIWGDLQGTLLGVGGNDKIYGRAGDDFIYGDAQTIGPAGRGGDDYLSGGDGDDRIYGDANTLYGVGGNDVIYQNGGGAQSFIAGDAVLLAAGAWGGNDKIYGSGFLHGDSLASFTDVTGGDDLVDASQATSASSVYGDGGGSTGGASICGSDQLKGSAFDDTVVGDTAGILSDTSVGGHDRLWGNGGDDQLFGDAAGVIRDFARAGNDILRGGAGKDQLFGDSRNALTGNAVGGKDKLYGGAGDDQLWGDGSVLDDAIGGKDRFFFEGSFGDDTVNDFRQGEDKLVFAGYQPDKLQITVVGSDTVLTTLGDDSVTLKGFTGALTFGTDILFA